MSRGSQRSNLLVSDETVDELNWLVQHGSFVGSPLFALTEFFARIAAADAYAASGKQKGKAKPHPMHGHAPGKTALPISKSAHSRLLMVASTLGCHPGRLFDDCVNRRIAAFRSAFKRASRDTGFVDALVASREAADE